MNAPEPMVGEVVPPEATTAVAEYSATAAGLADLRSRYAGARFDCTTTAGMAAASEARRELRTLRTSLEDLRQRIKAPVLERGRLIDEEARRITKEIVALEDPIDAQIRDEQARKEAERERKRAAERERVEAIAKRIEWIRGRFVEAVRADLDPDGIDDVVRELESLPITPELYEERINEAEEARTATVLELRALAGRMREQAAAAAKLAEERAAFERERVEYEAAERARREEREARERAERAEREAAEAAERARREEQEARERAEREEKERLERLERERVERAEREAREHAERVERETREREEREAADRRRAEREAVEREADPWGALSRIQQRAEVALARGGAVAFQAAVEDSHVIACETFAARTRLALLDSPSP